MTIKPEPIAPEQEKAYMAELAKMSAMAAPLTHRLRKMISEPKNNKKRPAVEESKQVEAVQG